MALEILAWTAGEFSARIPRRISIGILEEITRDIPEAMPRNIPERIPRITAGKCIEEAL